MASAVLTIKEVAALLRVHPGTVYRLLKRGEFPAFRIGSSWRFNAESIEAWRKKQEFKPAQEGGV